MLMRFNKNKLFKSLEQKYPTSDLIELLHLPQSWPNQIDGKLVKFKTNNPYEQANIDGYGVLKWWCDEVKDGNYTDCKG